MSGKGSVQCQFKGKGSFVPVELELTNDDLEGKLVVRDTETFDAETNAHLILRTADATGCVLGDLKKPRKGHPWAFRLDLAQKDSMKDTKYVVAVADAPELKRWIGILRGHSKTLAADIDEAVARIEASVAKAEAKLAKEEEAKRKKEERKEAERKRQEAKDRLAEQLHRKRATATLKPG